MIDVHMLLMGNENKQILDQCMDSLKDEPINLHVCEGILGDLRTARVNALRKGSNEYVGWVDPDDFIIPGSYQRLLDIIGDKKFAWSMEEVWHMDYSGNNIISKSIRKSPHHMHIIHRSLIDYDYIKNKVPPHAPDSWVLRLMPLGIFDKNIGYVWRSYAHSPAKRLLPMHSTSMSRDINK